MKKILIIIIVATQSFIFAGKPAFSESLVSAMSEQKISSEMMPDHRLAWSHIVENRLLERGFSPHNAFKYSRLRLGVFVEANEGDPEYDYKGMEIVNVPPGVFLTFKGMSKVIETNTERPEVFSNDPVEFANQLPDCYAEDEARDCKLIYSAWPAFRNILGESAQNQCRLTKTQREYCKKEEFSDSAPGQGCGLAYDGAGEFVVFDGPQDRAATKLAMNATPQAAAGAAQASLHPASLTPSVKRKRRHLEGDSNIFPVCRGTPAG